MSASLAKFTSLRLYTCVNFYLSSIQQGIQSAHVVSDLFTEYSTKTKPGRTLNTWAKKHKTMIVLNGGMNSDLEADVQALYDIGVEETFALTHFEEEPAALGRAQTATKGQTTAWGIVLPDTIFEARAEYEYLGGGQRRRTGDYLFGVIGVNEQRWTAGSMEAKICELIEKKPLAR